MKYVTRDREAGNVIDYFNTIEEAKTAIAEYEEEDKRDGTYAPNFYEVAEAGTDDYVLAIRHATGKSQKAFAEAYGIPITTIRNWEQGISEPPKYVLTLLEKVTSADLKNGAN